MKKPDKCPRCGEIVQWKYQESRWSGYSIPKGIAGFLIFHVVGLLAGFWGNEKKRFRCDACGFEEEYPH